MDTILMLLLIIQYFLGWGWMDGQLVLACLLVYLVGADLYDRMKAQPWWR